MDYEELMASPQPQPTTNFNDLVKFSRPQSAPNFTGLFSGQPVQSDATPDSIQPWAQYAMEDKRDPYQQVVIGGRVRGGEGGAGGSAKPEILSPRSASQSAPTLQNQLKELEDQQRSLMQLRPMVPTLIKLGVTPAEMTKMNPAEAYQFIKARSPQGMGTVDRDAERIVSDAIDKLRIQRSSIQGAILGQGE